MKCAIINYWFCDVHGAVLTAYALQRLLTDFEIRSQLVSVQMESDYQAGLSYDFVDKYMYWDNRRYTSRKDLRDLAKAYDCFLVGSDQVFRTEWVSDNWFLDFVPRKINKVAVSASFGTDELNCGTGQKRRIAYWLNRFNSLSVRELSGVNLCESISGRKDILQIMDPVFLIERDYYINLINESKVVEDEPFVISYFRDNSSYVLEEIQKHYREKGVKIINIDNNTPVVDFLYYFSRCERVITDSFHGMCFSIIFNKNFICLRNVLRGTSRFDSIKEIFQLSSDIFADSDDDLIAMIKDENAKIDYHKVNQIISERKTIDREWIYDAIQNKKSLNEKNMLTSYTKAFPFFIERPFDSKIKWIQGFIKKYLR